LIFNMAPSRALNDVSIIARGRNVVHGEGDHGENVSGADDADARVRYAQLPPVFYEQVNQEHVELARGMFQSVEAALEMTYLRSAWGTERLADVHVIFMGA
jgi:hypothetical protein